ncbi:MAG: pilin [Candidatus Moraniibacteriota bacterium]
MNLKIKCFFGSILFNLCLIQQVSAQTLEKIPGQENTTSNLVKYLNNLYLFGISAVAILAVFMIALGAFNYLVTAVGNPSKMQTAKETIVGALFGLALAFLAYLILYVINPDLVGGALGKPSKLVQGIMQEEQQSEGENYWKKGYTPPPVDGVCGSSNDGVFQSQPSSDLCAKGESSEVTATGTGWSWTCLGENGGGDDSCSATQTETEESVSDNIDSPEVINNPYSSYPALKSEYDDFPEKNTGVISDVRPYILQFGDQPVDGNKFSIYIPAGTESLQFNLNSTQSADLYMSIDNPPSKTNASGLENRTIEDLEESDRKTNFELGGGQKLIIIDDYSVDSSSWEDGKWIYFELEGLAKPAAYNARYRINTNHPNYSK